MPQAKEIQAQNLNQGQILKHYSKYLEKSILRLYGASRFLLASLILGKSEVTCDDIARLCCAEGALGGNYFVGDLAVIVKAAIGSLRRYHVPCFVDRRRMPPLAVYEHMGVISLSGKSVRVFQAPLLEIPLYANIAKLVARWRICGAGDVAHLARCTGAEAHELVKVLAALRLLFPNLLELYRDGSPFSQVLKGWGVGKVVPLEELWRAAEEFAMEGVSVPNFSLLPLPPRPRLVRAASAKYAIPPILAAAELKNAVVADIGCGYGNKGAASLRWGARHVVLIDIDEAVLRARGNGLLIDKVVADAHNLPLRDKSIDVAIFWNVLNFLHDPEKATEEIARIVRKEVVFSIYNASSSLRMSYGDFLNVARRWGYLKVVRRLGNSQFQAVVRLHEA